MPSARRTSRRVGACGPRCLRAAAQARAVLSHKKRSRGLGPASFTSEVRRQRPSRSARSTTKIRVHRRAARQTTSPHHDGLPVTTVARTLDRPRRRPSPPISLERVVHRAEHLRLLDTHSLDAQFARASGQPHKGAPPSARTPRRYARPRHHPLKARGAVPRPDRRASLPRPEVNAPSAPYEVDFFWPDHRLIIEADGAGTHLTADAFEDDRRRDAKLTTLGYRVVRFTWRQVAEQPRATIATLVLLLAAAG